MEFNGKVILISGATGGMGKGAALQLSKEKCKLAIFARREEKLKEISEEINTKNAECIYKKCDVKNRQEVKELANLKGFLTNKKLELLIKKMEEFTNKYKNFQVED